MFHEGSLVLYFPFGSLPLSLNPLKTVYSQEKRDWQGERRKTIPGIWNEI